MPTATATRTRTPERRSCPAQIEIRTNEDGRIGLRGYAAVFDSEAYGEVIRSGAFNRTLAQRDNVRLLVNHDGVPLASTKAGTMSLSVDERGLIVDCPDLDPANPTVAELVSAMARGDIDQMSFAGIFLDAKKNDGLREVREVALWDVSVVTFPWYDATEVGLRSARAVPSGFRRALNAEVIGERIAPPGETSWADIVSAITEAIEEACDCWAWIVDVGDDWAVYRTEADWNALYQVSWSIDYDAVTLGDPVLVVTTYLPADDPSAAASADPEQEMTTAERGMSLDLARAYIATGRAPAA